MSELPYIDLGADPATLRQYAQDHFGKKISPQAKDDTVKDRFKAIYFEETGVTLADVDPLLDDDDFEADMVVDQPAATTTAAVTTPAVRQPIAATIIVQDDPMDPGAICGAVNFVPFRIMRNVEVRVSIPQLNALKMAVKTTYDPKTMAPKDVLAYPFSVVEMHFE